MARNQGAATSKNSIAPVGDMSAQTVRQRLRNTSQRPTTMAGITKPISPLANTPNAARP